MNLAAVLGVLELKMQELLPDNVIDALESQVIFPNSGLNPTLGVIIKENDGSDSRSYLKSIQQKGKKYNANIDVREVKDAAEAADAINSLKNNPGVFGIINLSRFGGADRALNDMIPVRLDVDCASSYTLGMLMANASNIGYRLAPCAAVACYKLLEYNYGETLSGMNVAILGRSLRVGRPLAEILCQKNATVTVMHSKSKIHEQELWNYDVVISAMGAPEEITCFDLILEEDYDSGPHLIYPNFVIDVGMGIKNDKICGDIQRTLYFDKAEYMRMTPTIGGVGKLATVVLFSKLFTNAAKIRGIDI